MPLILVGEIAGEIIGINGYNMVRDYFLYRELHDCPGTTLEELWLKNHNPDCEICGGSGKIPGPIFCSNHDALIVKKIPMKDGGVHFARSDG